MKKNTLGGALKKYRKISGLSVQDVSLMLETEYHLKVAEKTIYGWESNQASPPSGTLLALCDIYKVERINDIIEERVQGFVITPEEREIIENYRQQPDFQSAVKRVLGIPDK